FVRRARGGEWRYRHGDGRAGGGRLGDKIGGENRAGARPVLDDEGFTQSLFEFLRQESSQDVGAAAWRERHDEGDLALRVSLGAILRTGRRDRQHRQADRKQSAARKGDSPFWHHRAVLPARPAWPDFVIGLRFTTTRAPASPQRGCGTSASKAASQINHRAVADVAKLPDLLRNGSG